jgi:hypothetical protein
VLTDRPVGEEEEEGEEGRDEGEEGGERRMGMGMRMRSMVKRRGTKRGGEWEVKRRELKMGERRKG